mmetsp:Transcript_60214/g.161569  ORF Transcript_60214/g.161569 Transcript_60214/m.161569 type:complete len:488 (+) Transcript_60214:710-2173(+)
MISRVREFLRALPVATRPSLHITRHPLHAPPARPRARSPRAPIRQLTRPITSQQIARLLLLRHITRLPPILRLPQHRPHPPLQPTVAVLRASRPPFPVPDLAVHRAGPRIAPHLERQGRAGRPGPTPGLAHGGAAKELDASLFATLVQGLLQPGLHPLLEAALLQGQGVLGLVALPFFPVGDFAVHVVCGSTSLLLDHLHFPLESFGRAQLPLQLVESSRALLVGFLALRQQLTTLALEALQVPLGLRPFPTRLRLDAGPLPRLRLHLRDLVVQLRLGPGAGRVGALDLVADLLQLGLGLRHDLLQPVPEQRAIRGGSNGARVARHLRLAGDVILHRRQPGPQLRRDGLVGQEGQAVQDLILGLPGVRGHVLARRHLHGCVSLLHHRFHLCVHHGICASLLSRGLEQSSSNPHRSLPAALEIKVRKLVVALGELIIHGGVEDTVRGARSAAQLQEGRSCLLPACRVRLQQNIHRISRHRRRRTAHCG